MTVRTQTPPNLSNQPRVDFKLNSFEAAIWQKGYNIVLEEARQCPCRDINSGSPKSDCQNCRGIGWLFINPIETRAVITSINRKGQYTEWSEESVGTISATLMYVNRLADYDRVTFKDTLSKKSEIYRVREHGDKRFVFLTYRPSEIIDVFIYTSSTEPLRKLSTTSYYIDELNPYVLVFDSEVSFVNNMVTITYLHYPQYCVIDLPHDLRSSNIVDGRGREELANFPINAILRKVHMMFTRNDYGDGGIEVFDNSYLM